MAKGNYIKEIKEILSVVKDMELSLSDEAKSFLDNYEELLKENSLSKSKADFTENGKKIFDFMQENKDKYNNCFKAKDIAEGLFVSGRSVSSSLRKLITDGYVAKEGKDPVIYSLTDF